MLYNPNWQIPDLEYEGVSLRAFIAWLETMPAQDAYEYVDPAICATAQFLRAQGKRGSEVWVAIGCEDILPGCGWLYDIVATKPHTFGAALARAKQYRVR